MNKTETVIVITASGEISSKEIIYDEENCMLHGLHEIVDGYIETVEPMLMPAEYIMIVNEEGLLKELPFNRVASSISGFAIFGNVALMKKGMRNGEPDLVGIPGDELIGILAQIIFSDARGMPEHGEDGK